MPVSIALIQNNFISGEVSPLLEGRVDSPRYQTGLRTCQNFIPLKTGGLRKRPGTHYIGGTKNGAKARLISIMGTDGKYYVLEFTATVCRIWDDNFSLVGAPTEITTPYNATQVFEFKYAVMKGVIWIVHPAHAPRTITLSGGTWSISTPTFTGDRTFAASNKYPKAVFFHSGRLGLAGTNDEPNAVFLSRPPVAISGTDRFTDFAMGTSADNAIYLQEADMNGTHIHWAIAQRRLIVATDKTIWMDNGQLVTPANFDMNIAAYTGASELQAVLSANIVLYVGRGGTSLHALIFTEEGGGFVDYNLSETAEHLLAEGIVDMQIQSFPEPIVWLVRSDGMLLTCTLDFKNGVVAWSSHPMDGLVESVTVGVCETEDNVWLSVNHGGIRYVEVLRFCDVFTAEQEDLFYVDCGLTFTSGSPTNTVTGLEHLEGSDVTAWADGAVLPTKTVTSGSVTYDTTFSKIHIGLPIESEIETLRPEIPVQGTSQGKQKAIQNVKLRLYRSLGGSVSSRLSSQQTQLLYWIGGTHIWGSIIPLYTDTKAVELGSALDPDATIIVHHDAPAPFNILAIIYKVAIMEV